MITRKILVIDDDSTQAEALARTLASIIPESEVLYASDEENILDLIKNKFYNLAVLDIRMDGFKFNGLKIAETILEVNPFAKIIFVSRFLPEYMEQLAPLLQNGNVLGFSDKKADSTTWGMELCGMILPYYEKLDADPQAINTALVNMYSRLKDMENIILKGSRFEDFVSLLFQSIGFSEIRKRARDRSSNEVDLIIRNDIDDIFLNKFGKYILVECKNHLDEISKNDFILFREKLANTSSMAELGFLITTSTFKRTAYLEAIRSSRDDRKIIFIDNAIIMRLLQSENRLEEIKRIIDDQVKDN